MNKELKLVPLSIPAGWMVNQNHFYMTTFEEAERGYPFYEDILQMNNESLRLTMDLGWYPEADKDERFKLVLLPWEKPMLCLKKPLKEAFKMKILFMKLKKI